MERNEFEALVPCKVSEEEWIGIVESKDQSTLDWPAYIEKYREDYYYEVQACKKERVQTLRAFRRLVDAVERLLKKVRFYIRKYELYRPTQEDMDVLHEAGIPLCSTLEGIKERLVNWLLSINPRFYDECVRYGVNCL